MKKIKEELKKREAVRLEVEKWLEKKKWTPFFLKDIPVNAAFIARHVATCRFEDLCFYEMTQKRGLNPVWFEYTHDSFTPSQSSFKKSIGHPIIQEGVGRKGGAILNKKRLVDFSKWDGKKIEDINKGELVRWHHSRNKQFFPKGVNINGSSWFQGIGDAKKYYTAYLSLFLAHAALFEDYYGGESGKTLDSFTVNVFEPARETLKKLFGLELLIISLPWKKHYKYFPANTKMQLDL